jgi:general secretion pathway protein G
MMKTSRLSAPPCPKTVRSSGFTLLEVMVVIAIIAVMAALVVPNVMGRFGEAQYKAAKTDIASIASALKLYQVDNGSYPSTEQGLAALVNKPSGQPEAPNWRNSYIEKLPRDPWQHPYQYLRPGQHGEFDLYSLGADGKPGGEKNDADLGNWDTN